MSLKTQEDRTLFFDFLQLELGTISNLTPKIHLYTVPGQTYYEASRRLVLKGADGVVFVADSAADRLNSNLQSWRMMKEHLRSLGMSHEELPIVLQFNKQDLSNALAPEVLQRYMRTNGYQSFAAIAIEGQGVVETLKAVTRRVFEMVQQGMSS